MTAERESRVPLFGLAAEHRSLAPEIEAAIAGVFAHRGFVGGPEIARLEGDFAALCGTEWAVGCGSGSDAVWLALAALEVGPGDEVICPAFTFFATASAIERLGARPVFADIDRATWNLTPEIARAAAADCTRLRAVLPVDLFGRCADAAGFEALGSELGVPIVSDAAQAVSATDGDGRTAGSRALLGCFSLYPTKNLGACGEAGMVVGHDPALRDRVRALGQHGHVGDGVYEWVGINSRLDALQAAIVRAKLPHLEKWTLARRENASFYDAAFAAAGATTTDRPTADPDWRLPLRTPLPPEAPARHVYHHYAVRVPAERRDALRRHLAECGVESGVYYARGLHQQPCFAHRVRGPLPETESACAETLVLPIHAQLSAGQRQRVVDAVLGFFDA